VYVCTCHVMDERNTCTNVGCDADGDLRPTRCAADRPANSMPCRAVDTMGLYFSAVPNCSKKLRIVEWDCDRFWRCGGRCCFLVAHELHAGSVLVATGLVLGSVDHLVELHTDGLRVVDGDPGDAHTASHKLVRLLLAQLLLWVPSPTTHVEDQPQRELTHLPCDRLVGVLAGLARTLALELRFQLGRALEGLQVLARVPHPRASELLLCGKRHHVRKSHDELEKVLEMQLQSASAPLDRLLVHNYHARPDKNKANFTHRDEIVDELESVDQHQILFKVEQLRRQDRITDRARAVGERDVDFCSDASYFRSTKSVCSM